MNRRDFLKLLSRALLGASAAVGIGEALRFLSYAPERPPSAFDVGLPSDYPLGSEVLRPEIPALIRHDESGFAALSLVCTHLGCTVQKETNDGFRCPCHGSRFDESGKRTQGPAKDPLPTLPIEIRSDGHVWVSAEPLSEG